MPRLSQKQQDKIKATVVNHIDVYSTQRRRAKINRDTISASLGMSVPTMYKRLRKPGIITLDELFNIANALNISIYTLLGVPNERYEPKNEEEEQE